MELPILHSGFGQNEAKNADNLLSKSCTISVTMKLREPASPEILRPPIARGRFGGINIFRSAIREFCVGY
jgi:hypothetical protein